MPFKISTGFAQYANEDLDPKASHVVTQTTANAASLPGLTALVTSLGVAQVNLHNSIAASAEGGKSLTIDKKAKRVIVINIMRQLVTAIEAIPNITQAIAALSGFDTYVPGGHRTPLTPDAPTIAGLDNSQHGKLGVGLQGTNAKRGYELQYSVEGAAPVSGGFFSSTRDIAIPNLVAGKMHAVQARALGGGNTASDWSPAVSAMCT
jgi:hypothetical protein